jgi:hypothetical protein
MAASADIFVTPFLRAFVVPEKYAGTTPPYVSHTSRNLFRNKRREDGRFHPYAIFQGED